jgi:hypothetical protein
VNGWLWGERWKSAGSPSRRKRKLPWRWVDAIHSVSLNGLAHIAKLQGTLSPLYLHEIACLFFPLILCLEAPSRKVMQMLSLESWSGYYPNQSSAQRQQEFHLLCIFILSLHASRLNKVPTFHNHQSLPILLKVETLRIF